MTIIRNSTYLNRHTSQATVLLVSCSAQQVVPLVGKKKNQVTLGPDDL